MYNGLNQAGYQLGYALGRWLFSSNSNPQAELQKQQMMAELQRRQAEAERQHREEEARQLAAMYNRLSATLKLSGLPNLQLKDVAGNSPGLTLKLGDSTGGQAGIKGLPGIYLNDGAVPYGIPGLPGIYTGGPGQGSGLTNSRLALKTGDSDTGAAPVANVPGGPNGNGQPPGTPAAATNGSTPTLANESGLQLKTGDSSAGPAAQATTMDPTLDPGKMTPQQLADVAEQVSKLPPEEQQRLLTAAQNDAAAGQPNPGATAQALAPVQAQAAASQAAATAPVLEDASAKARAGFDQPLGSAPVQLEATTSTPAILRPTGTAGAANGSPSASAPNPPPVANDWVKQFLFPGSLSSTSFAKNPNPPLTNPLREEKKLQAELKTWDDWAIQRATHIYDRPNDNSMLYPLGTELALLNASAVKQYAPELLARYKRDTAFRQNVDQRLRYAAEDAALEYYQGLADAHKAAITAFQTSLENLAAAGALDKLVPLEEQYRLHPDRRQIVQSAWDRVSAKEQTALAAAQADGSSKLDQKYQFVFQLIRGEAAQQR
jgi:hypothetical protein